MARWNYFRILCLLRAVPGIGTRLLMGLLGRRWNNREPEKAYGRRKPEWLTGVCLSGMLLIAYTWYAVFSLDIAHGWIMAMLISLAAVKIYMLIFRYDEFREFVKATLNNKREMFRLNLAVLVFSALCLAMALFLY